MSEAPDAAHAAADFVRCMVPFWRGALGADLIGVYLLGSLAHGGFSARYSDVDVALVTETGVPGPVLERTRGQAVELSADWGPKLSVFWTDRQFRIGRFPPLDRIDYIDHAVPLTERERLLPERPTLEQVRAYLAGRPFSEWADWARSFAAAATLEPKDRKSYLRTLLYPARFCMSWMTGRMASNDAAVAFLRGAPVPGLDGNLIARALDIRQAGADPDPLFAARAVLPSQADACAALMARS